MPNPENVEKYKLKPGEERTKRIASMGGKASKAARDRRADTKYVGNRLGKMLLLQLKKSGCINADNCSSYEEALASDGDVLDKILKLLIDDALSGGKTAARARTQVLEYLMAADEVKRDNDASEFLKALVNSPNDWNNE